MREQVCRSLGRTRLRAELRKTLGPAIRVEVNEVAEIPLTAAGKLRVVVRTIPAEWPDAAAAAGGSR